MLTLMYDGTEVTCVHVYISCARDTISGPRVTKSSGHDCLNCAYYTVLSIVQYLFLKKIRYLDIPYIYTIDNMFLKKKNTYISLKPLLLFCILTTQLNAESLSIYFVC
jgi:hypothetical protein